MPALISRDQRNDLRRDALSCLTEVCDESALALQNDDWETARDLRLKYEALMSAWDRLGWQEVTDPLTREFAAPDSAALLYLAPTSRTATKLLASGR